jgi:hypothetical protein
VIKPLPHTWQVRIGRLFGGIVRVMPLAYVRIARRNIESCLPELSPDARKTLATTNACDHSRRSRDSIIFNVRSRGAAVSSWSGGHFTTIEIGTRILGTVIPINVLFRPTKNEVLSGFMSRQIASHAQRAIQYDDIAPRPHDRCRRNDVFPQARPLSKTAPKRILRHQMLRFRYVPGTVIPYGASRSETDQGLAIPSRRQSLTRRRQP